MKNTPTYDEIQEKLVEVNDIDEYIKILCQPQIMELWGSKSECTPALVSEKQGDGMQLIFITPIDTRPNFYVLRVDSKTDIEDYEQWCYDANGLQFIEEEYGNIDDYDETIENGEYRYTYHWDKSEVKLSEEVDFPMLSWSGGSWGVIKNFELCQ